MNIRRIIATLLVVLGAGLSIFAFHAAKQIPSLAEADFNTFAVAKIKADGGFWSHAPGVPESIKQMDVDRRLLQNGYIGASGLVLLATGTFGWVCPQCRREDT